MTSLAAKISGVRLDSGADFLRNGCYKEWNKTGINHDLYTVYVSSHRLLLFNICERACKNRPSECKKLPIFSEFAVS